MPFVLACMPYYPRSGIHRHHQLFPSVMQVLDSPNREAVEPVVVVRGIDTTRIEVQVVAVSRRVQRRRPVVAVRAVVVETRTVPVARGREEEPTKPQ